MTVHLRAVAAVGFALALVGLGMFLWVVGRGLAGGIDGTIAANDDLMPWFPLSIMAMVGGLIVAAAGLAVSNRAAR